MMRLPSKPVKAAHGAREIYEVKMGLGTLTRLRSNRARGREAPARWGQVFFVPPRESAVELRRSSPRSWTRRWTVVTEQPRWVAI